jgi:hypothetical protein
MADSDKKDLRNGKKLLEEYLEMIVLGGYPPVMINKDNVSGSSKSGENNGDKIKAKSK